MTAPGAAVHGRAKRLELVDALRAMALAGVIFMNMMTFGDGGTGGQQGGGNGGEHLVHGELLQVTLHSAPGRRHELRAGLDYLLPPCVALIDVKPQILPAGIRSDTVPGEAPGGGRIRLTVSAAAPGHDARCRRRTADAEPPGPELRSIYAIFSGDPVSLLDAGCRTSGG